ncbi:uncharacterized protein LOC130549403 [Triplophysa rosa]|uniref:uncharacterized protein LOC130549403 n=1 Tax=Triplophysa rosa TaxID=992332 RepID=UPI0025462C61|nr:uncharacterized protein LOC130549403 [Triplophysa rosa]
MKQRTDLFEGIDDISFQAPMVKISGPEGPIMVYRPWTVSDMKEAMTHLPDPFDSGKRFAEEPLIFCQEFSPTMPELRRLLAVKMGPANWHKVSAEAGNGQERREHTNWNNDENRPYTVAVTTLCNAIKTAFPARLDLTKVSDCMQKKDESVQDYYVHLYDVFKRYSGIHEPTNRGEEAGLWESHLRNCFLNGLRPDIVTSVKSTCINWKNERLYNVCAHAVHAQEKQDDKQERKREHSDKQLQLVMTAVAQQQGGNAVSRPQRNLYRRKSDGL